MLNHSIQLSIPIKKTLQINKQRLYADNCKSLHEQTKWKPDNIVELLKIYMCRNPLQGFKLL